MIIISKAPVRICLFGGGSDVNPFAEKYCGAVINFAINFHTTIKFCDESMEVTKDFRSRGLGGSASFFVALCGGLNKDEMLDRKKIANQAFKIETEILGWHGGRQDQYCSAVGGFNLMEFDNDVHILPLPREQIEGFLPWLVLYDIGGSRDSFNIQQGFVSPSDEQIASLKKIKNLAYIAMVLFKKNDYFALSELLGEAWEEKKKSNVVTNKRIDDIYDFGLKSGAIGGKLMGAGQGGHFLFAVEPQKRNGFLNRMKEIGLTELQFQVDFNGLEVKKIE